LVSRDNFSDFASEASLLTEEQSLNTRVLRTPISAVNSRHVRTACGNHGTQCGRTRAYLYGCDEPSIVMVKTTDTCAVALITNTASSRIWGVLVQIEETIKVIADRRLEFLMFISPIQINFNLGLTYSLSFSYF